MNRGNWYTSTAVIVFAFIFFWPAGLVLLYLRWKNKNGKYQTKTKILKVASGFLIFMGFIGLTEYFSSYLLEDLILALFLFLAPGIICGFMGIKRSRLIKSYQKYVDYIKVRRTVEIDDVANKFNINYNRMVDIITDMIHKELIFGYIQDNVFVMDFIDDNFVQYSDPVKKETRVIKCKECGAKNSVITGQKKECDYCGTILQ